MTRAEWRRFNSVGNAFFCVVLAVCTAPIWHDATGSILAGTTISTAFAAWLLWCFRRIDDWVEPKLFGPEEEGRSEVGR